MEDIFKSIQEDLNAQRDWIEKSFTSENDIEKSMIHKYFKREGTPGNYKYYYTEADYKAGKSHSEESNTKSSTKTYYKTKDGFQDKQGNEMLPVNFEKITSIDIKATSKKVKNVIMTPIIVTINKGKEDEINYVVPSSDEEDDYVYTAFDQLKELGDIPSFSVSPVAFCKKYNIKLDSEFINQ